jgi:gamma-glutamylcyclotransferase (GGCT)/AIG2-like uncharacterized protein YtfP
MSEGSSTPDISRIPPPPPPPPPRRQEQTARPPPPQLPKKDSSHVLHRNATKRLMLALLGERTEHKEPPLTPCHLFFYGTLTDPEVLQTVINSKNTPTMPRATAKGFTVKMWGIYPALLPCSAGEVLGAVWECASDAHFQRLAEYETSAYSWYKCTVVLEDGTEVLNCYTFCWAGDADSKELESGSFDLERYQKDFKSSVVRKPMA